MKVLLLTRYDTLGASSRVRYLYYLPYVEQHGISMTVSPLLSNQYLEALYCGKPRWREVLRGFCRRCFTLLKVFQYDLVIIEKEIFPFIPALVERLLRVFGVSYLVDYDDAWFHRYDQHPMAWVRIFLGHKIDAVMRNASVVTAGNSYLAERATTAGAHSVVTIPTVVDSNRYYPASIKMHQDEVIIGWIGSPKTSHYLKPLLPVIERVQKQVRVRFVAVGASETDFQGTSIEVRSWTEQTEVALIQHFDIGVMPLEDSLWERGKCGYKLIQYMACGLPVVASPVGVNTEIVKENVNGLLAENEQQWEEKLLRLCLSVELRERMGMAGRRMVEDWYSLDVQQKRFCSVIKEAAV